MAEKSIAERVHRFVLDRAAEKGERRSFSSDPFWKGLRDLGTRLWLDTGDIEAAAQLWTAEFSALTTNNTLLNKEVQKGIYDDVIKEAGTFLEGVAEEDRVIEIAFILNALHALKLVGTFGARVSVELHTALAHDLERTLSYARRFHRINPDSFIVKVPLTPSGFIATRTLRLEKIPVNFTLGFSARHNYIATGFSFPNYVNVFLGRLNSYVADNELGDGSMVGEKATIASQRATRRLSEANDRLTRQIAASMRSGEQVRDLAGVDVMTMPTSSAAEARKSLSGRWESAVEKDYTVTLAEGVSQSEVRLGVLWDVDPAAEKLLTSLTDKPPATAEEFIDRAHSVGAGDMFPRLSDADLKEIARQGKIPKHAYWASRIAERELAVDTLMNLAGLAHFAKDQKELDDRVRRIIE